MSKATCNFLQEDYDCFVFQRSDIGETNKTDFQNGKVKIIYGGDKHVGADGFFFRKEWWFKNSDLFHDDLILAETEFDTCYRRIMERSNCKKERCLFHVYHDQVWNTTSPSAQHNIKIFLDQERKYDST